MRAERKSTSNTSMAPGPDLLMGAAETVAGISDLFEPVLMGRTAFYRRKN